MNNLRALRKAKGMALWGVAAKARASVAMLSAIEKWNYVPRCDVRERIASALGVSVDDIWPSAPVGEGDAHVAAE